MPLGVQTITISAVALLRRLVQLVGFDLERAVLVSTLHVLVLILFANGGKVGWHNDGLVRSQCDTQGR